jgi:NADPH:quinone reductase
MKLWWFDQYGPPSVLQLREREIPSPGKGEVLVKIAATAVNPSDVKNVAGHFKTVLPRVPGRDFAGIVVDGDGPHGTEIWGSGPGWGVARDGAHAEYVVMPASWISRKPASISLEQASTVGVPYLAAWTALITAGDLQPGETVLVTGVSGAVGRAATQIAHSKGARVIGAALSMENPSGADAMIDTTKDDLAKRVFELTGGQGAGLVFDTVGGALFEPCLKALRIGGRQAAIASNPQVVSFNLVDFYHGRKRLIGVDTVQLSGSDIVQILDQLRSGFEEGVLVPSEIQLWSFTDAPAAYQAVARGSEKKQVLKVEARR